MYDNLEQVVNDEKVMGGLGFAASIARQHLVCEIMKNKVSDPFRLKVNTTLNQTFPRLQQNLT